MSSEIVIKFLVAAVLAGTPFLFGTVGEILSEKVGHLNLGVEGMMSIGACAGFMVGYQTDNFVAALLAAAVAGMLSALIYGVLTVTFMANQNVTGLTLTIFGVGLANFIGVFMLEKSENGTLKLPDAVTAQMRNIHIPGLSDLPVVGELLFSYNPFVYLGIIIAIVASFYLYKTQVGLNVQAIGENQGAADAAGIEVTKWRYINILLSGAICGIAGFVIVSGASHTISTATAGGRGFTAIIVAWLSKFNTFIMVAVSFGIVFMDQGAVQIATQYGLNENASDVILGIILFFLIGAEFFINYRVKRAKK